MFTVVDTPGFGDSDKEDSVLIDEMMAVLKGSIKSASVLLLVLDGNQVTKSAFVHFVFFAWINCLDFGFSSLISKQYFTKQDV